MLTICTFNQTSKDGMTIEEQTLLHKKNIAEQEVDSFLHRIYDMTQFQKQNNTFQSAWSKSHKNETYYHRICIKIKNEEEMFPLRIGHQFILENEETYRILHQPNQSNPFALLHEESYTIIKTFRYLDEIVIEEAFTLNVPNKAFSPIKEIVD